MNTKIFHTGSMKKLVVEITKHEKWPKVQLQVMPVCASIAQRSVLIHPWNLRLITTENVDVKCAAFKLVNMCSGKNCLRLDLFTVKTFCCVVVEVLTWFSSDWSDVPGSRFSSRLFVFITCFLVKVHCFFHLVLLTGTSQFFHILCL